MRRILAAAGLFLTLSLLPASAWAWGSAGHSIVGEIAQRRLNHRAAHQVAHLIGRGASLASVASWADDVRDARPYSYNWHFVDIPVTDGEYVPARDCADNTRGDCVIAELDRLASTLRCARSDSERVEALRFAVHFVGDLHQPLHTMLEERGGNDVQVSVSIQGMVCRPDRPCNAFPSNLHSVWDSGLIDKTVWNWGAYVDRLEGGWLRTDAARAAHGGDPLQWALDSHTQAQRIWAMTPADKVLNDDYYRAAQPILDRQLALGGIHLADFLNAAFKRGCGHGVFATLWPRHTRH